MEDAGRTRQLKETLIDTVQRLTRMAEYRDEDSHAHVRRSGYYAALIARELGIPADEAEIMSYASPMHDIGKIAIPDSILLKTGPLTPREIEIMKTHTTVGGRILGGSDSPYLRSAEKFALYHHEHWDGTGYPFGLKGEEIPIEGRIMFLIDQYDALRSRRPYKPPFGHDAAAAIIAKGNYRSSPGYYDPKLLEIFLANEAGFAEIFDRFRKP
jgi:putative two-component system response regulator